MALDAARGPPGGIIGGSRRAHDRETRWAPVVLPVPPCGAANMGSDTVTTPIGPVTRAGTLASRFVHLNLKGPMQRYTRSASWYDAVSAEPVYRVGRERAIPALNLRAGSRVLDIGCGTGLNFPHLLAAVGPRGQVVGVDRSHQMLDVARRKTSDRAPGIVTLLKADAEQLDQIDGGLDALGGPFDAVLFTYSLSLMGNWEQAWLLATSLLRPEGRAGIVDMEPPQGWARLFDPAARLACLLGGADINARPWTSLEQTAQDVESWSLRGGHVQVRVGTL